HGVSPHPGPPPVSGAGGRREGGGDRCVCATVNAAVAVYRGSARARIFTRMNTTQIETATKTTATKWTIDAMHTTVGFSIRHMMVTNVRGEFQRVKGAVRYDARRPEAMEIEAEIQADSIFTR